MMCTKTIFESIKSDILDLGIDASVVQGPLHPVDGGYDIDVIFKSNEDLNYYKVAGKWKENWYTLFRVGK